ncbi:MAG: RpiB/LacA/LacB family sugar-phosphate isomerase [Bacilli bacterium]|nr:RpiB/LacA/LacB family sugar-phosphate isomerase [Bacilli bacterium]
MKIGIATDHNGVNEKKILIEYLTKKGYEMVDYSPKNDPLDDYPKFAHKVCKAIQKHEVDLGILLCGTGIGMAIAANKHRGIRCGLASTVDEARLARGHNNAQILAMSHKEDIDLLRAMALTFIEEHFYADERHVRRLKEIEEYEDEY